MTAQQIKLIINGAHGRMGQEAVATVAQEPSLKLVAALDKQDDLASSIQQYKADVVLDFTNADSVLVNTKTIITNKACPVIGSSGLLEDDITELKNLAKAYNISGIIVPNFSIGAVLMMKFSSIAAKYYDQVEIIERHHADKLDAPSGTALRTAQLIAQTRRKPLIHNHKSKETIPHALGANYNNIPVHSLRLNGSCAHQTVLFGGLDETLSITHDSLHRRSFMPGVILACTKVKTLKGLQIGLEQLLDL
ncbi:MAG: 4-hydroxy-tetrahydrodipicolinate reductase [Gammaproteobacteria bacterium]|nr:4-hydroxy-tetrahydrodipicolinate reductase [Gammaproteobacteria bacterium]